VVHVHNQLHADVLTLHWHGLHVENNTWMDGVPYVTQCPVLPRQTFTYRVLASSPGTHWYHSHVVGQRLDGLFGVLLVHEHAPKVPYSVVTVMDWNHRGFDHWYVTNPYDADRPGNGELHVNDRRRMYSADGVELSVLRYQSGLINGRGRFNASSSLPLTRFRVQRAQRHRFHVVNTGAEYTMEIAIDNHPLVIVASEGTKINPITVDFLHVFPGERYEFDVLANKKESAYWFRAQTLSHGVGTFPKDDGITQEILAIMEYETSSVTAPNSRKKKCSLTNSCTVFNCPFKGYHYKHHRKCISIAQSQAKDATNKDYREQFGLDDAGENVEEIFLNFAFSYGSSINARRFIEPTVPFHQNRTGAIVPCPEYCDEEGCRCTHTLHIPHNKTIQMVLTGLMPGFPFMAHHAVHLHGYSFAVLKMGYGELNESTGFWSGNNEDIACNNELCSKPRWSDAATPVLNLKDPPVKDTVIIPARGYTVIRFRANNPGYWRLHCHQELHLVEGMDMLVIEGEKEEMISPPPPHFPTCHQFDWSSKDFTRYTNAQQSTPG
jgi:FtsP/CotA-like multicopper oxidase with cupredoxin domain